MARIIQYLPGEYKVETEVISPYTHQLHVGENDQVGILNISNDKYVNGQMEPFNEWVNPSGSNYTSLSDLISDLKTFFFDIDVSDLYTEVNTFADLPLASTNTGITYHVLQPTGTWILGTRRQSGYYRSNGTDWILRNDISSLLVDNEFNIRDDADSTKGIRFVLDSLASGFIRAITFQDKDYIVADDADARGSVIVHSDVTDSGSGQIITTQERTDINASISVHSDVQLSGVTLLVNTLLRYNGSNFIACLHQIVKSSVLLINNSSTLQDKINVNINVQRLVVHKIVVSFSWSLNDGGQDLVAVASFGGQNLMIALTDNTEIFRQEPKDTGGTDPEGRGTNQRQSFHRTFFVTPTSAGNNALILQFAGSANGDLASMWEASIEVEELISITGT